MHRIAEAEHGMAARQRVLRSWTVDSYFYRDRAVPVRCKFPGALRQLLDAISG